MEYILLILFVSVGVSPPIEVEKIEGIKSEKDCYVMKARIDLDYAEILGKHINVKTFCLKKP